MSEHHETLILDDNLYSYLIKYLNQTNPYKQIELVSEYI